MRKDYHAFSVSVLCLTEEMQKEDTLQVHPQWHRRAEKPNMINQLLQDFGELLELMFVLWKLLLKNYRANWKICKEDEESVAWRLQTVKGRNYLLLVDNCCSACLWANVYIHAAIISLSVIIPEAVSKNWISKYQKKKINKTESEVGSRNILLMHFSKSNLKEVKQKEQKTHFHPIFPPVAGLVLNENVCFVKAVVQIISPTYCLF